MKKIIFMLSAIFMANTIFAMSKPKEEPFMEKTFQEDTMSKGTEEITGFPVFVGNAPFEKLALKVPQNDNSPEVYYIIEFEKNSKVTEKEIAALQGQKIQLSGKIEKSADSTIFSDHKIIVKNYKK